MCLIVHRNKAGTHIPNKVIEHNLRVNSDGFGIGWREGDKLFHARYGPSEAAVFHNHLKDIDRTKSEYMAHFRLGTHGPCTVDMAHPFEYEDRDAGKVLVFHNGIISISGSHDKSDTFHFVEKVLKQLPPRWWNDDALLWLVQQGIGYSRLSVMTEDASVRIAGDSAWILDNGVYYSTQPYRTYGKVGSWYTNYSPARPVNNSLAEDDDDDDEYEENYRDYYYGPEGMSRKTTAPKEEGTAALDALGLYRPSVGKVVVDAEWKHVGHDIEPVDDVVKDDNGEAYGQAWCRQCDTLGEYYLMDGNVYLQVPHLADTIGEEEEEDVKIAGLITSGR